MGECQDIYVSGKESAKKHSKISHYTSFEALKCILENKSLRITRLDMLNDAYENKRTDEVWKEKIFTTSFTYRKTESYMFWSLYAKDNGVMLTFDNEFFYNHNFDIYADAACTIPFLKYENSETNYKRNIDYFDWLLRDMTYADVTYTSDFKEFKIVDTDLKRVFEGCKIIGKNNDFTYSLFPGLLKGIEWDSEQEVRLRVALSYRGMSNSPSTGSPSTPFNYVYIPIADALKTLFITMNPWHCDCFEKNLSDLLKENQLTANCKILESTMRNQIRR